MIKVYHKSLDNNQKGLKMKPDIEIDPGAVHVH